MVETKKTPSPEQQKIIDSWGAGMAVLAGAGSGKTTTLVSKCAKLIERNPQARFAAVSFTERSASDLKAKLSLELSKIAGPGALHSHWVMTIHGLCGSIIREFPREAGLDGEETVLADAEAQLLWDRATEALWVEELSDDVRISFEKLLDRESRDSLANLLKRVRDLKSFGILTHLQSAQDADALALEKVSRYVVDRYERLKLRQGALDFNDLERGADRALESPSVREAYHRRFDLVLVDEFQDTNPLQAKIILRLARPDLSNLCVVGDPKQSIYRFRDADVSVFEEFCSRMPIQASLTWNFRSRPGIIHFANEVCEKAFLSSQMKFDALVPKREPSLNEASVIRFDLKNPIELGQWLLSEVERGVPLHEMALLVRRIRGNEKWFKALSACGIPIAVGSGGLFWEEPRVRELVAFLRWWDNPGNSLSGAIFLRAPWMSISDLNLDQWTKLDPTLRGPFFQSNHPVAQALKSYQNKNARPGELLMALLVDQKMEDELAAPLLGLWHRVEEFSSRGLDFHAIVTELSTAIQENRREREVPAPKNLGQLSVLTFHGSKGLEFPHVILIDFGEKTRAGEMPLLFWDRNQGSFLGRRDEDGDRDRDHPVEANWRELEKIKNLAESKRLFYVALTRAQERLILVCPELKKMDQEFNPDEIFQQDFWRGWLECAGTEVSALEWNRELHPSQIKNELRFAGGKFEKTDLQFQQSWTRARHSVTEWTLLSRCPRAYEWTFIRPQGVADGIPDLGLFTGEKVTSLLETEISHQELGTRVHACLENLNYSGLKALEAEVGTSRFQAEPVVSWAMSSPWMLPTDPAQGRTVWTELPFEVPFQNEVLVGTIDRVVLNESEAQRKYTIVDFKVTERPKSVAALLESYQTQLDLYAWALTALEPEVSLDQIEAALVNISAATVQVVPVPLGRLRVSDLIRDSLGVIAGKSGKPQPSRLCQYCEFRFQCPEGAESITA